MLPVLTLSSYYRDLCPTKPKTPSIQPFMHVFKAEISFLIYKMWVKVVLTLRECQTQMIVLCLKVIS